MALERITVWEAFQVLTAAAQNGEFNNIVDYITALEVSYDADIAALEAEDLVLDGRLDTAEPKITTLEGKVTATALTRIVVIKVIADDTALTTGDGKTFFTVPAELNGMDLVSVGAHVYTVSSSGTPTIQLARVRSGTPSDMLSTRITIDSSEKDSKDAATAAVINAANDDVATGDEIRVDVDVAGTGTAGLEVRLGFRLP